MRTRSLSGRPGRGTLPTVRRVGWDYGRETEMIPVTTTAKQPERWPVEYDVPIEELARRQGV